MSIKLVLVPVFLLAFAITANAQGNSASSTQGNATSTAKTEAKGAEMRSDVAKFVKSLLLVGDRNGGLGAEVSKIAKEQASSTEVVEEAKEKVGKKSKALTLLFGPDYKNLGALRSELVKTSARVEALKRELERMPWEGVNLEAAIKALEDEQAKLMEFIKVNESKFSVFGWAAKLFQ